MEAGTTSITLTAKLPILNPGEYDLWLMRIEQYFLITDYSLWEVILNGNKVLKRKIGEQEYEPTTIEERQDRRNEMKARGTLLMALLNKDQLKFHSYKDAKLIMEAIEKRYEVNKESKKVQRTLLKQQYENFSRLISKTMDQTFDRSLPSEWKTHALIWRNKVEIETISLDDLYNNLKIYELELKDSTNTSQNSQNVAFVSSNSTNNNISTNEADNTVYGVSTAHTQSSPTSGDNLSDAVICAFLVSHPNSPQISREDLEQIDPDDLEEMDLQWEMAMLTIRARRFIKRTSRQLDVNGKRVRFDSYQAEEEHPTNFALMAHTSSRSSSSSNYEVDSCSKSYVKAYASLKEQYDNLNSDYNKSQFNLVSYKAGLESVEATLAHYKKNEVVFEESINVLKLEVRLRDNALVENKRKLEKAEKAEKERDELKLTLEKFQNSSKFLNNLLESQVSDKFKTGLGYNAATAASPTVERNFIPRKPDLTFIDEIVESENMDVTTVITPSDFEKDMSNHESAGVKNNGDAVEPKTVRENNFIPPIIEDWNSDDESEIDYTVRSSIEKIRFVKPARETVEKFLKALTEETKCYITESEDYDGGFVSFGDGKGRISGKGKIKIGTLDFENGIKREFSVARTPQQNGAPVAESEEIGRMTLRLQGTCMIWLGHIRDLEDDEEGLVSVLVKLETSFGKYICVRCLDEVLVSLVAAAEMEQRKAIVFNTRIQQTKETYHITFDESPDAIKFSSPLVDNINIAETRRYPSNEYVFLMKPSTKFHLPKCQDDQNDHSAQTGENLSNVVYIRRILLLNTIPIPISLIILIASMVTPSFLKVTVGRWDKTHRDVNIIGFDLKGYLDSGYVGMQPWTGKRTSVLTEIADMYGCCYSREIVAKGTLKKSCLPPRVKVDYARLIWEDIIHKLSKKCTGENVLFRLSPRFISLLLEYMMPEYDNEELTINPTQVFNVLVDPKASNLPSQTEEVPQGKNPEAKSGLRRKQSSKHTSESTEIRIQSQKLNQSEKETQSSLAKDKSLTILHLPYQWLVKCY
ncbi:hypothetical protein Tco_1246647 [Tanacetum coccineum]